MVSKDQGIMAKAPSTAHALSENISTGYKWTDLGVIPTDWYVFTVGELFDFLRTASNSRADLGDSGVVAYVHYGDLHTRFNHFIDFSRDNVPRLLVGESVTAARLIDGDLIVADASEDEAGVGKSVEVRNLGTTEAVSGLHTLLLRSKNRRVQDGYRGYLLENEPVKSQLRRLATGLKVFGISKQALRDVRIPLPSPSEQRAIAEALSDVDGMLAALEALIAKKRAIKQAAMQQLLTGKTRLPGFNGSWETKRLGELIHLVPSGIYGLATQTGQLIGMPVATTAHIDLNDRWNDKKMDIRYFTEHQIAHFSPIEGDLIVVKSSGSATSIQSGKVGYVSHDNAGSFIYSNFLMLLRSTCCDAQFLFFQLVSSRVKNMLPHLVEASTYPNIRINDYLELQIPLPPDEEQVALVNILSDMDAEIAALESRQDKTRAIKQGMMQQLLTGRVRLVEPESIEDA